MYVNHDLPSTASHSGDANTDANQLRFLLKAANLSQRSAAKYLNVDERTMRSWCAGDGRPPAPVLRALEFRAAYPMGLMRMIESNERTISAIQDGHFSQVSEGPDAEVKCAAELERLKRLNQEYEAMLRMDRASHRRREALLGMNEQWLPRGSGLPTEDLLDEFNAADEEFRSAQSECDRITDEIRAGMR
jgi:DNA-binding transcriptional regulator YiaG